MEKGSGTRSGLLWEVERILTECNEWGKEHLPQLLLMENVCQVHGAGNEKHFKQWMLRLEELGYQNYWQDLSATEFKIPQTRNRTFMVSILNGKNGEKYNYTFPKKTKLELRLKDLLEPEGTVDEKYYISDKMLNYISKTGGGGGTLTKTQESTLKSQGRSQQTKTKEQEQQTTCQANFPDNFDLSSINKPSFEEAYDKIKNSSYNQNQRRIQEDDVCDTLCARDWKDPKLVIEKSKRIGGLYDKGDETHQAGSIYDSNYSSPTLDCSSGGGNRQPFIVEKSKGSKSLKETLEKVDVDSIDDVAYLDAYNRNAITNGTAKTILTGVDYRNQDYLLIKNATKQGYLKANEGDGIDISSRMESHRGTVQKGKSQTITTMGGENVGVVVKENTPKEDDILKKELCNKLIKDGLVDEYDVVKHSYTNQILDGNKKCVEKSDGVMITLTTRGDCVGVVVKEKDIDKVEVLGNYSPSNHESSRIVSSSSSYPTVKENHGTVPAIDESELLGGIGEKDSNGGTQWKYQNRVYSSSSSPSVTTAFNPNYKCGLRIRKLTPKECFRLQGVTDENIALIMENQSNSLGYHLAGDSICITVLMGIISAFYDGVNWLDHFNPKEWWKKD